MYVCEVLEKMRFRLLIITLIGFICTTLINVADKIYVSDNESVLSNYEAPLNNGFEISNEDFDILNPAESSYSCQNQNTRTFSKRKSEHRLPSRHTFCTCGKSYNVILISNYPHSFNQNSNGLLIPFRSHISLGILRI